MKLYDTKTELEIAGYTYKGKGKCPKCSEDVEEFESPSGARITRLNAANHPTRPGWLHSLGCNKDAQKDFEMMAPAEPQDASEAKV